MTDEERILWRHLWRIPVEGTHFRKQAPLGAFTPDFVSHRLKLIIEVDGGQHGFEHAASVRISDAPSGSAAQGYRVVRFWNHEVKTELEAVLDTIYAAVEDAESSLSTMLHVQSAEAHPTPALTRRPSPSRGGSIAPSSAAPCACRACALRPIRRDMPPGRR